MTVAKGKVLAATLSQQEKAFGRSAIMRMGESRGDWVPVLSSDSLSLDMALGIGDYLGGWIVEIYDSEGSGRAMLALYAVAEAPKASETVLYADAEQALDVFDSVAALKRQAEIEGASDNSYFGLQGRLAIIEGSGFWYSDDERMNQGVARVKGFFGTNPEVAGAIVSRIWYSGVQVEG